MNKSRKKRHPWRRYLIIITALTLLSGCRSSKDNSDITTQDLLVKTMTIGTGGAGETHAYSGDVRGRYENQMAFQVAGKIIKRNVDLGTDVRTGDILMQIDPADLKQGLDARKAQVSAAESQYAVAKGNLERFKELLKEDLMSRVEYDKYQNVCDSAEAALKQANAQYALALNQLDYCNLKADRSGIVSAVYAEAGQVVAAGQPVVALVKGSEREVEINIPENRVTDLKRDQVFKVTFWAMPGVAVEGKVREISPVADAITRTYRARISLITPPSGLKLGMTATVTGAENSQAGLYVPLSAVYQTGDRPMVWVVDNGVVTLRSVKIGSFAEGDYVQVLEGLKGGDVIVIAGVHKLKEGDKVRMLGEDK